MTLPPQVIEVSQKDATYSISFSIVDKLGSAQALTGLFVHLDFADPLNLSNAVNVVFRNDPDQVNNKGICYWDVISSQTTNIINPARGSIYLTDGVNYRQEWCKVLIKVKDIKPSV